MSGIPKRLLFGGMTLALFFLALEAGSRLLGAVNYPPDPLIAEGNAGWNHSREYDPLLFWRLRPGSGVQGDTVNSMGLRGAEIPDKGEGELRLLSLGESTTYGWKIPSEESYSARLEQRLDAFGDARVINGGMPGYTLFQARVFLEHRGLMLRPDVVLLYFGFNDFLEVAFRDKRDSLADSSSRALTDRQLFERRQRGSARLADWLFRRSNFVRRLGATLSGRSEESASASAGLIQRKAGMHRVPEEDRWDALREIHRICQDEGIELVLIVPWYRSFTGHAPLLRRFAAEYAVTLVDLPAALPDGVDFFTDPSHPDAEGHALIADEIWNVAGARWRARLVRQ